MKKLRILLLMLVAVVATIAKAEGMQFLVLDLKDGSHTFFALNEKPTITFANNELKVMVADEVKLTAPLSEVAKYAFSESSTGIQQIVGETTRLQYGHVYIANAKKGEVVRVYTVSGKLMGSQPVAEDGTADIDLTTLGKGLYIVKAPSMSLKVMNK